MATQRKSPTQPNGAPPDPSSTSSTTTTAAPPRRNPLLPSRLESLLVALYPTTLLLGSLYSVVNPLTRNTEYSAVTQSHPAAVAPSYFAHKKNIFNLYFVKIGWFWATISVLLLLLTHPHFGAAQLTTRRLQAVLRWGLVTAWWAAVTQWFFGPPIIDRGFLFTGGQCERLADPVAREGMSGERMVFTAAACKAVGGTWKGGHDISGHVFLLILGSAMLTLEVLPLVARMGWWREDRSVVMEDGKVRGVAGDVRTEEAPRCSEVQERLGKAGVWFVAGVAGLSWWMLLMTAIFFHTWFEKFTGLLVAFAAIWTVYFLPRGVPPLRAVLGMPGL